MALEDILNITAALITIGGLVLAIFKWAERRASRAPKQSSQSTWQPASMPNPRLPSRVAKVVWRWGLGIGFLELVGFGLFSHVYADQPQGADVASGLVIIAAFFIGVPIASLGTILQTRRFELCVAAGCIAGAFSIIPVQVLIATSPTVPPSSGWGQFLLYGVIGSAIFIGLFAALASVIGGITLLVIYLFTSG